MSEREEKRQSKCDLQQNVTDRDELNKMTFFEAQVLMDLEAPLSKENSRRRSARFPFFVFRN